MGTLPRNQTRVREILGEHDLLLVAGADVLRMSVWSPTDPLPPELPLIQIGLDDWELGKNYSAEIALRADLKETLNALTPLLQEKGGATHARVAGARVQAIEAKNWSVKRVSRQEEIQALASQTPIAPEWLMLQIAEAIPADAVVVEEGLSSTTSLLQFLPYRDRYGYHAFASGGIGWAMAASAGIQIARPERPLVAVIGDGSALFSIQALWTAAHLDLPITYVIPNNRGYRILKQRLLSFHGNTNYVGMDLMDPEIDFVGLAKSLGVEAERITDPAAIRPAIEASVAAGKPRLLDVAVDRAV